MSSLRRRLGAFRRRMLEPERAAVARDVERLRTDLTAIRAMVESEHAEAVAAVAALGDVPQPALIRELTPHRNQGAVKARAAGYDPFVTVLPGDFGAVDRVAEIATGSAGAAMAVGVIETLPAADVVDLLRHMVRVVRPGGIVLVESANPTTLATFTGDLYRDPQVRRPYHPSLVRFLLAEAGCGRVEMEWLDAIGAGLDPSDDTRDNLDTDDAARINDLLFGPTRYLAVGHR